MKYIVELLDKFTTARTLNRDDSNIILGDESKLCLPHVCVETTENWRKLPLFQGKKKKIPAPPIENDFMRSHGKPSSFLCLFLQKISHSMNSKFMVSEHLDPKGYPEN